MKRFALYPLPFILLAACDSPSAPVPPTAGIQQTTVERASAQVFNERFPVSGFTAFNSCPPSEVVLIEKGFLHFVLTSTEAGGTVRQQFHLNAQGIQGVGLTTGAKYSVQDNERDKFEFTTTPPFSFSETFDVRFRLIRQGSLDNFYLRQTITVSFPPFEFEVIRNEIECRG